MKLTGRIFFGSMIPIKFRSNEISVKREEERMGYEKNSKKRHHYPGRSHDDVLNGMRQSKPAETTKAPETTTASGFLRGDTEAEETTAEAAKTDDGKQFKIGVLQLVQHSRTWMRQTRDLSRRLMTPGINYTGGSAELPPRRSSRPVRPSPASW